MKTLITYASEYGTTLQYAKRLAKLCNLEYKNIDDVKNIDGYDRIIHLGALYAGGVKGLKDIVKLLKDDTRFIIATVGLADVNDPININNIRNSIKKQIPEDLYNRTKIYHLRGGINYKKLKLVHRTMMAMLYKKACSIPENEQNAETKAMIATYNQEVSFVDDKYLTDLINDIK